MGGPLESTALLDAGLFQAWVEAGQLEFAVASERLLWACSALADQQLDQRHLEVCWALLCFLRGALRLQLGWTALR